MSEVADYLAIALAAGAAATKKHNAAAAIKDRLRALRRALEKKGVDDVADKTKLEAATKDRESIQTAKELLGLIKLDDAAREAVDIEEVEKTLIALSAIDLPDPSARRPEKPPVTTEAKPPTTSRRFAPPEEPSKTELERTALPIWQRTDRFFLKVGLVVASYIVLFGVYWLFIRTPPNDAMDRCREGEAARCWEAIAAEDTVDQGKKVSSEPLQLLCEKHDPCGCAGLAYLKAAATTGEADCSGFAQASSIDPTWPCSCARYNFWRYGKAKSSACGIARCE